MILPSAVKIAMNILETSGFECYAVGGCVRDFVMGRSPGDYDLTTSAEPSEMISCFEGFRIIETGIKHGTVTVVIDGFNVEITTYRIDGEYKDNRRPESVLFTSKLSDDLSRRDFTVNAMAFNESVGIVDLFSGQEDLKAKIIRCVGNPDKRFSEDGLRILRALRFASVLDFEVEASTAKSIVENRFLLENISRERVFSELTKLICGCGAERILGQFPEVFDVILGETQNVCGLSLTKPDLRVRYSVLLRDSLRVKEIMRSLRADNKTIDSVVKVCSCKERDLSAFARVKRLVRDIGVENALILAEARRAYMNGDEIESLKNHIEAAEKSCCTIKQLEISGEDVMKLGFSGCAVGKVLNSALDAVIDGLIENKKDKLSEFVKSMLDN